MPAELRVDVIAQTSVHEAAMLNATDGRWQHPTDTASWTGGGEALAEFAGRACYGSWHKPHPGRQTNKEYLAHILEVEHLSVLRHATVTVYIQGVSRSLTHELIRHHVGIDYSQLSQRYVDAADMDYVIPPAMRGDEFAEGELYEAWREALSRYTRHVDRLEAQGKTRKQAREAARAFLPGCCESKIVVTANLQAWRNFIAQRATPFADAEIRELAVSLAWTLKQGFPNALQDMHLRVVEGEPDTVYFGEYDPA